MMSPDPPRERENSSDASEDNPNPTIIPVWDEDDFFAGDNATYELDIGSGGEESDFSDSEHEDGPRNEGVSEQEDNITTASTRIRGRYQLLIPFPTADPTSNDVEYVANIHGQSHSVNQSVPVPREIIPASNANINENISQEISSSPSSSSAQLTETEQRDINLTKENVEVIKTVMKNFTLNPAAIPPWAEELSDDALKSKLSQSADERKSKSIEKNN